MGLSYQAVGWNRQKKIYDAVVIVLGVVLYLALFVGVGAWHCTRQRPGRRCSSAPLGTAAFLLLHVVLSIGPLCRLDRRFLPLLYNRRHLGVVTMFLLGPGCTAGSRCSSSTRLGDVNPLVSVLIGNAQLRQPERTSRSSRSAWSPWRSCS